jgi:hypothetical protein
VAGFVICLKQLPVHQQAQENSSGRKVPPERNLLVHCFSIFRNKQVIDHLLIKMTDRITGDVVVNRADKYGLGRTDHRRY